MILPRRLAFLDKVDNDAVSFEDLLAHRPAAWGRRDTRLFLAILAALKGISESKYHLSMETQRSQTSGRQALRVLMQSMSIQNERIAMTALQKLSGLTCNKMQDLEDVFIKFEHFRRRAEIRAIRPLPCACAR